MKVIYKPHNRSRSIRVRLSGSNSLIITYPTTLSEERVKQYFIKHKNRIMAECTSYVDSSYEKLANRTFTVLPDNSTITFVQGNEAKIQKKNNNLLIQYHSAEDFVRCEFIDKLKVEAVNFLKKRAKPYLSKKLRHFADEYGYTYNRVFFKNQKSRWGSCSSRNNINLNVRLVLLPEYLIDYVLLHELVHTVEKSHNKHFWSRLSQHMPRCKENRKELQTYMFSFLD